MIFGSVMLFGIMTYFGVPFAVSFWITMVGAILFIAAEEKAKKDKRDFYAKSNKQGE
jgi:hypothetical protein